VGQTSLPGGKSAYFGAVFFSRPTQSSSDTLCEANELEAVV